MSDPIVEMTFAAGLDEATRDELVEPGQGWLELVNVRQDHRGAVTKRPGYGSLARTRLDASTRGAGNRLFSALDRICVIDGHVLDAWSSTASVSITKDRVPECIAYRYGVTGTAQSTIGSNPVPRVEVGYASGYYVLAWLQYETGGTSPSYTLYAQVLDATTRSVVYGPTAIATSVRSEALHVVSYGVNAFVVYGSALSTITERHIDLTSASTINSGWSSTSNLATDWDTSGGAEWHAISLGSGATKCALGYGRASDGALKTFSAAGVLQTQAISGAASGINLGGTQADVIWVAYGAGVLRGQDGTSITTTTASAATVDGSASIPMHVVRTGAQTGLLVSGARWRRFAVSAGAVSPTGTAQAPGGELIGGPFSIDGRYYAAFTTGNGRRDTFIVGDVSEESTTRRPVANVAPRLVQDTTSGATCAQNAAVVSSTKVAYAIPILKASVAVGIDIVELDFSERNRWKPVSFNGLTLLAGGVVTYFDGVRVSELGFLDRPATPTLALVGAGSITKTDIRYVAAYEQVDALGNWHISGLSNPSATTSPATQNVDVTVAAFPCTARHDASNNTSQSRVVLFRQNEVGGVYYRVNGSERSTYGQTTLTIRDSTNDVSAFQLLYTQPGLAGTALDRQAPPSMSCLVEVNGMLVGVDDNDQLRWSGQAVQGEGPWFSDVFQTPVPGEGRITALAAQDGTLYVFKRRGIFAVSGDAPSDNGSVGGLGTPRQLAVDVGCIDPNSIVVTSLGIFFQSERGIELLTRGGAVMWIGEKIQSTLASYPIVSSAVLDDRAGLVRFSLADGEIDGRVGGIFQPVGADLVFDLSLQAWQSTDIKTGTFPSEPSQDAAMVYLNGAWRYAWLGVGGTVYYERLSNDGSAHLDGSAWVTMRAVTPWVAIGGHNGEQFFDQVLLLAKRFTGHDLSIALAFDYSDSYASTRVFTATQIAALAREWIAREVSQTTSTSVRVKLEDATPSSGSVGTGQGATWVALTFNGQPHRGPKRSSGAQRGGS